MLKSFVKSLDGVDEKFRDLYEKTEGGFLLQVEDKDYKSKLDEFRSNNINLNNQIKQLTTTAEKFKDVDPEKYAEMHAQLDELKDKKLMDEGKVDELIEQRTERMRQETANQISTLTKAKETAESNATKLQTQLHGIAVNDGITKTVGDIAVVRQGAMTDILSRAGSVWAVSEKGGLEAKDSEGNIIYGKDGKDPLTPKEWVEDLHKEAPFLFEPNKGGGAPGSGKPQPGAKVISPGDKAAFADNIDAIADGTVVVTDG